MYGFQSCTVPRGVSDKGHQLLRFNSVFLCIEQHAGNDPIDWTERKTDSDERHSFEETRRDDEFIYLNDSSRGYSIRLPVAGGNSALSADGGKTWKSLYEVEQKKE